MDSTDSHPSVGDALASSSPPGHPVVDLKILTQSPEMSNQLQFHDIRTSTTIGELKLHINNASSTRIPVESQRLIYKGRRLAADGDTLATVLGQDAVNPAAPIVIHLVHTDPRAGRPATQPSANRNPQAAQNQPAPVPQPPAPFPQLAAPFPIPFNVPPQHMIHHFNAMFGHMRNVAQPPGMGAPQGGNPVQPNGGPPRPSSVPLAGQIPTGNPMTNQAVPPIGQRVTMTVNAPMALPQGIPPGQQFPPMPQMMMQPLPWVPGANPPFGVRLPVNVPQGMTGSFGTNRGESYSSAESVRANQLRHNMSQMALRLRTLREQIAEIVRRERDGQAADTTSGPLPVQVQHQPVLRGLGELEGEIHRLNHQMDAWAVEEAALRHLVSLYAFQPAPLFSGGLLGQPQVAPGMLPGGATFTMPPTFQPNQPPHAPMPGLGQQGPPHFQVAGLNAPQALPANGLHIPQGAERGQGNSGGAPAQTSLSQTAAQSASIDGSAPTVFLLSSPTGPSALLLSPEATYSTTAFPAAVHALPPSFNVGVSAINQNQANQAHASGLSGQRAPGLDPQPPQQNERTRAAMPQVRRQQEPQQGQPQQGEPQQRQGQGGADLVRFLLSLWAPVWLLIRTGGLLWLFGFGTWSRYLLTLGFFMIVGGIQAGLFGDRWERIRRHFQRLLPLAPEPGAAAAAPAAPEGGRNGEAQGDQQRPGEQARRHPAPEEAAQRLIREREERDRSWIRNRFERVERAVALFFASLWPGVGERHIRAREEAEREARRLAEERRVEEERRAAEGGPTTNDQPNQENKGKETADDIGIATSSAIETEAGSSAVDRGEGSSGVKHREPQAERQALVDV